MTSVDLESCDFGKNCTTCKISFLGQQKKKNYVLATDNQGNWLFSVVFISLLSWHIVMDSRFNWNFNGKQQENYCHSTQIHAFSVSV